MTRLLVRAFAVVVFFGVVALLFHDRTTGVSTAEPALVSSATADASVAVTFKDVAIDRLRPLARGTFEITIDSARPNSRITQMAFSPATVLGLRGVGREWTHGDQCHWAEYTDARDHSSVVAECAGSLVLTTDWPELFFPFDGHRLSLNPVVCIEPKADECTRDGANAVIRTVTIELGEAEYVVPIHPATDGSALIWSLRRKPFLRVAAVVLASSALVYLILLVGNAEREGMQDLFTRSFGFLGVLWGLRTILVPSSIRIFPTLVDLFVIVTFLVVFMFVLWRYNAPNPQQEEKWVD